MFGYVTEEQFKIFKEYWEKKKSKTFDSGILESCKQLANTGELIPILYSGGYNDIKNKTSTKKTKVTNKSIFHRYILMAVKPGHSLLFTRFDQWCSELSYDDWLKIKPTLSAGLLHAGIIDHSLERTSFHYWMLDFKYKLCADSGNRHVFKDPSWMSEMWSDMIKYIAR